MKRRLFFLIAVCALLGFAACAANSPGEPTSSPEQTPYETERPNEDTVGPVAMPALPPPRPTGRILVISNGIEHEPYIHFFDDIMRTEDGELLSVSGGAIMYEALFGTLAEISYADDFAIVREGRYITDEARVIYTFYNSNFERVISDHTIEEFSFPDETGVYLLILTAEWGRGGEFSRLAYIFKIRK